MGTAHCLCCCLNNKQGAWAATETGIFNGRALQEPHNTLTNNKGGKTTNQPARNDAQTAACALGWDVQTSCTPPPIPPEPGLGCRLRPAAAFQPHTQLSLVSSCSRKGRNPSGRDPDAGSHWAEPSVHLGRMGAKAGQPLGAAGFSLHLPEIQTARGKAARSS